MLNEEQTRQLAAMVLVHREFTAGNAARVAALVRGQAMVMSGTLTVGQVAKAVGVSAGTWHRWARELGLRKLAIGVVAEVDQALREAGADESTTLADIKADPDLALAAGAIGVWQR